MPTAISNLWVPQIWIQGVQEKLATFPALINSPICVRNPQFDEFASGAGTTVNLPYFRDISDQADAPQAENTQPTKQVIGSGKQIAALLNRETANDATALAAQVSGSQPVEAIVGQLAIRRQKQRQTTMINILRGLFNNAAAPSAATGCLYTVRNDIFLEAGASPAAGQCVSVGAIVDTIAMLGELADTVKGGGILMHPSIRAALLKQDQISFEHYSNQPLELSGKPQAQGTDTSAFPAFGTGRVEYYKGMRVFLSNALRRAGSASGYVFDTYIFAPGVFAWGEKPQAGDTVDVASLSYWMDKQKNNEEIYDRTRFILHPNGCQWTGAPAGQSATNTELATYGNWALDYSSADRVGIVALRTNG
jgi:hypothetical protein